MKKSLIKLFILTFVLSVFLVPSVVFGAVVFDVGEASGAWQAATSSITFSHTTTGTDRILLVSTHDNAGTGNAVSSVTYAGTNLTNRVIKDNAIDERVEIWSLLAPATGANNVVVTWTNASTVVAGAASFTGANAVQNTATNNGTAASITVTITSATGNMAFAAATSDNIATFTPNDTDIWNVLNNPNGAAGAQRIAGAASVTIDWTGTDAQRWVTAGLDIVAGVQPAAAGKPRRQIIEEGMKIKHEDAVYLV